MSLRNAFALIPILSWLAVGCTAPPLSPETPPTVSPLAISASEWRVTDHVFVLTDASGTMYDAATFPKAKALSQAFVDSLPEPSARAKDKTYSVANIGFGGKERVALPLQRFDRRALRASVDQVQVMGEVDGSGGTTPLHHVIADIGRQLEGQSGRAAIVLFSDGNPDDAAAALDAATKLARRYRDGVCFHGVQLGDDVVGAQTLQTLAEISSPCGSFRNARDLPSGQAVSGFTHGVMVASAPSPRMPPAVAAANPCTGMTLRNVEFGLDKASLSQGDTSVLDRAAAQLGKCRDVNLLIEGHTDERGAESYNQSLSERRATAVRDYLVQRGVAADRLSTTGRGEADPLSTGGTEADFQLNRRVELKPR